MLVEKVSALEIRGRVEELLVRKRSHTPESDKFEKRTHFSPEAYEEREGREEGWVVNVEQDIAPSVWDKALNCVIYGPGACGQDDCSQQTLLNGDAEGHLQPGALVLLE